MRQSLPSKRKRIALFAPGGLTPEGRGIHTPSLSRIVSGLSESYDITVYSLITFESDREPTNCGRARVVLVSARYDMHWMRKVAALLREFIVDHRRSPFDAVHAMLGILPEITALAGSTLMRIPCCISLFGGETANIPEINYGSLRSLVLRFATTLVINRADLVTVLTNFQRAEISSLGFSPKRLLVIPHGLDKSFGSGKQKQTLSNPYRFLHVGSITPVKDQETMLRSFSLIRKSVGAILRIVGPDYMNGSLQKSAQRLGLQEDVEFVGYVSPEKISGHYEWADVLLHTSLHEGQGVVLVEAAASRTLLAGTNVGLLWDFDDSMALRVATGDAEALAEKVLSALKDPSRVRQMRERAFQWTRRHDLQETLRRYSSAYKTLIGRE